MTDTSPTTIAEERWALQLILRGGRPLAAADLGKLLTTLARDYKRTSRGRTLVVTSLRPGSTIVELMDVAAVAAPVLGNVADLAKAAGSLAEFAKFMFSSLQRKKQGDPPALDQIPGDASADAVIEAASKINGEIEVTETRTKDVTVRKIKVTTVEAISIREREKTERAQIRAEMALIEGPPAQKLLGGQRPSQVAEAIRRLSSTGASRLDVNAAIGPFVSALKLLGLAHMVETFAVDFESAGEFELAALLRSARENGNGPTVTV